MIHATKNKKNWILLILIAIIILLIWLSYSLYSQQRWNMYYAVNEMYQTAYNTYEDIEKMSDYQYEVPFRINEQLFTLFNETEELTRHFNMYEESVNTIDLPMYLNNSYFNKALKKLMLRNQQGLWSDMDKNYYEEIRAKTQSLGLLLEEETNEFNMGNIFATFNVEEAGTIIKDINKLNFSYVAANQTSVKRLKESALINEIEERLNLYADTIKLAEHSSGYGWNNYYRLEVGSIRGEVSPYTGVVNRLENYPTSEAIDTLSKTDAQLLATAFLNDVFKGDYPYKFNYKGFNYNHTFSGDNNQTKLHSFLVTPMNNGYPYIQPFNNEFSIFIDNKTGVIDSFRLTSLSEKTNAFFSNQFFTKEFDETISIEEAKEMIINLKEKDLIDADNLSYQQTGIIYSMITGDFELVHHFEQDHNRVYIHAEEGYLDEPYVDMS